MRKVDRYLGMMRALLRQAMILSDETDSDVVCFVHKRTTSYDKFGTVHVGNYTVEFSADPDKTELDYEPEGRIKEWLQGISDSEVHSLTEPPRKEGPAAGQSTRDPEQN